MTIITHINIKMNININMYININMIAAFIHIINIFKRDTRIKISIDSTFSIKKSSVIFIL